MRLIVKTIYRLFLFQLLMVGLYSNSTSAHEVRPSIIDLTITKNGSIDLEIKLNLEAIIAGIGAEHKNTSQSANAPEYDRLRKLSAKQLRDTFEKSQTKFIKSIALKSDGTLLVLNLSATNVPETGDIDFSRTSVVKLTGKLPSGAKTITWNWEESMGTGIVRVTGASKNGKTIFAALVKGGSTSKPINLKGLVSPGALSVFLQYIQVGIEHIIPKGLDHILFVVGLFLLSTRFSSLLWQISSFTVAHTITLGLAMAGIISAPANFVEPLIALSIVYVAIENIFTSNLNHWRTLVVFMFGLLHGLGFASVLNDVGLPQRSFFSALIGFNIGVELGQLTVISICFILIGMWFRNKPYYRKFITNPASALIALTGAWWFLERTVL